MNISRTVVLIDDDSEISKGIRKLVQTALPNVRVVDFREGDLAIQYIENSLPDLILTDVLMPKMNGLSLLKAIKTHMNKYVKNIPVVVLTGVGNRELNLQARRLGAVDYILKPFHSKVFILKVKRLLKITDT